MAQGRRQFTLEEAEQIRNLLREKTRADRDQQKRIRGKLRKIGFYITDFDNSSEAFTEADFNELVEIGTISIMK